MAVLIILFLAIIGALAFFKIFQLKRLNKEIPLKNAWDDFLKANENNQSIKDFNEKLEDFIIADLLSPKKCFQNYNKLFEDKLVIPPQNNEPNLLTRSIMQLDDPKQRSFFPKWFQKRKFIVTLRRPLGVATFLYACLHLGSFFLKEGSMGAVWETYSGAVYLWSGTLAWVGLFALAVTSNERSVRHLGFLKPEADP